MDSIERNARLDVRKIVTDAVYELHPDMPLGSGASFLRRLHEAGLTLLPLEPDDATVDAMSDAIVAAEETESASGKAFYRAVARAAYRAAVNGC